MQRKVLSSRGERLKRMAVRKGLGRLVGSSVTR
jgi:hypothetical protein